MLRRRDPCFSAPIWLILCDVHLCATCLQVQLRRAGRAGGNRNYRYPIISQDNNLLLSQGPATGEVSRSRPPDLYNFYESENTAERTHSFMSSFFRYTCCFGRGACSTGPSSSGNGSPGQSGRSSSEDELLLRRQGSSYLPRNTPAAPLLDETRASSSSLYSSNYSLYSPYNDHLFYLDRGFSGTSWETCVSLGNRTSGHISEKNYRDERSTKSKYNTTLDVDDRGYASVDAWGQQSLSKNNDSFPKSGKKVEVVTDVQECPHCLQDIPQRKLVFSRPVTILDKNSDDKNKTNATVKNNHFKNGAGGGLVPEHVNKPVDPENKACIGEMSGGSSTCASSVCVATSAQKVVQGAVAQSSCSVCCLARQRKRNEEHDVMMSTPANDAVSTTLTGAKKVHHPFLSGGTSCMEHQPSHDKLFLKVVQTKNARAEPSGSSSPPPVQEDAISLQRGQPDVYSCPVCERKIHKECRDALWAKNYRRCLLCGHPIFRPRRAFDERILEKEKPALLWALVQERLEKLSPESEDGATWSYIKRNTQKQSDEGADCKVNAPRQLQLLGCGGRREPVGQHINWWNCCGARVAPVEEPGTTSDILNEQGAILFDEREHVASLMRSTSNVGDDFTLDLVPLWYEGADKHGARRSSDVLAVARQWAAMPIFRHDKEFAFAALVGRGDWRAVRDAVSEDGTVKGSFAHKNGVPQELAEEKFLTPQELAHHFGNLEDEVLDLSLHSWSGASAQRSRLGSAFFPREEIILARSTTSSGTRIRSSTTSETSVPSITRTRTTRSTGFLASDKGFLLALAKACPQIFFVTESLFEAFVRPLLEDRLYNLPQRIRPRSSNCSKRRGRKLNSIEMKKSGLLDVFVDEQSGKLVGVNLSATDKLCCSCSSSANQNGQRTSSTSTTGNFSATGKASKKARKQRSSSTSALPSASLSYEDQLSILLLRHAQISFVAYLMRGGELDRISEFLAPLMKDIDRGEINNLHRFTGCTVSSCATSTGTACGGVPPSCSSDITENNNAPNSDNHEHQISSSRNKKIPIGGGAVSKFFAEKIALEKSKGLAEEANYDEEAAGPSCVPLAENEEDWDREHGPLCFEENQTNTIATDVPTGPVEAEVGGERVPLQLYRQFEEFSIGDEDEEEPTWSEIMAGL